jgi:iron-sulfur cluster assembly accessory protein
MTILEIVKLTEKAQAQALRLKREQAATKDGLRIAITGGGCSGLKNSLKFDLLKEDDFVCEYPGGLVVMVDPKSAPLLEGATLEFHDGLDRTGFEVSNPNSTGGCGCGKSFSV